MADSKRSLDGIRHFIWDFDGTLFDTYPVIIQNLRNALANFGQDADPVEVMTLMLDTIPAAQEYYARKFQIPLEELQAAYSTYNRQANAALVAAPMADARQVLEAICQAGGTHYIFTHRKLDETCAYLEKYGMRHLFRGIIAPQMPGFAWKPAPDALQHLMKLYGFGPGEAVMVGDRQLDLASGRNAGVATLHFRCGAVPQTLACDWCVDSFRDIQALL